MGAVGGLLGVGTCAGGELGLGSCGWGVIGVGSCGGGVIGVQSCGGGVMNVGCMTLLGVVALDMVWVVGARSTCCGWASSAAAAMDLHASTSHQTHQLNLSQPY